MSERQSSWRGREPPLTPDECKRGRELAIWSIADLAGRSGVDPLTVQRFEAGEAPGVGFQLLAAFARHGMQREQFGPDYVRWCLEGCPFNASPDFKPHVGKQFVYDQFEAGKDWLGGADLEWPRSDDLPADLFVRPVPAPYWAEGPDPKGPGHGAEIMGEWSGYLTELDAEWVRRNPDALERWPELVDAMAKHEAR